MDWIAAKLGPAVPRAPMGSIGSTGIMSTGGFIVEDGRYTNRTGLQRYRDYDLMMTNVSIVAAGIRLFLNVLSKAEWTVNPAEDQEQSPVAREYADAAYDMMFDMTTPWANVVRKLSMFKFYGFAVLEWTAKMREDGSIGILDLANRPQRTIERWELDDRGGVAGCYQGVMGKPSLLLPRDRLVYAVDDALTEHPEGMGLFVHLLWVAKKLKAFQELEEIGFETDLRGFPVAYGPLAAIQAEKENHAIEVNGISDKGDSWARQMIAPLRNFVANHIKSRNQGAVFDSETYRSQTADGGAPSTARKWALELLQGDSASFDSIAAAITRETEAAARIIGVEHLLLGQSGDGSLALSKTKQGGFYMTVTSALGDIVEVLERDWLGPIATLNGWPNDMIPTLAVEAISDVDIAEITDALAKMAQAGAVLMPDDPVIGEVRDMMGLSRQPEDGMAVDAALLANNPPDQTIDPAMLDMNGEPLHKRERIKNWITSQRSKRRMAKRAA